jgi:ABC-2 type transport system permease protein
MYSLAFLVNVCGFLWSAGIAMRFRSIQAGPLMQMPVFILLFFAPVYVPLDLLSGAMHSIAVLNPITYVLEAGRSLISGQPEEVALAFCLAAALAGALVLWAFRGLRRAEAAG